MNSNSALTVCGSATAACPYTWEWQPAAGGGCGIRTHVRLLSNGFQEYNQRIPLPLSSVQFVLKQSQKILIPQGFSGLFGTDLNQNELVGIDMN